jgi:hypothetical protein
MAFHRRTLICGLPAALLVLGALAACQRAEAPAFNAVSWS